MPRGKLGGEIGGEHVPTAGNLGPVSSTIEPSIPGFSAEQVASITKLMKNMIDTALKDLRVELHLQPQYPTQSNQPIQNPPKPSEQSPLPQQSFVPLPFQPITKQQEQEKTVEKTAENISGNASSKADNESTLSTIPSQNAIRISGESTQNTKQLCRKYAPYTGFLASLLASSQASLFGFIDTSFLASLFGRLLGYIRCTEDMEASGQG